MIEPTESYTKKELDRFIEAVTAYQRFDRPIPFVLKSAPHFTPISVDEEATEIYVYMNLSTGCLPSS